MNREDFKSKCVKEGLSWEEIIDKLYDNIESSTCENCKYFGGLDTDGVIDCSKYGMISVDTSNGFDYDFGCNKFEHKE